MTWFSGSATKRIPGTLLAPREIIPPNRAWARLGHVRYHGAGVTIRAPVGDMVGEGATIRVMPPPCTLYLAPRPISEAAPAIPCHCAHIRDEARLCQGRSSDPCHPLGDVQHAPARIKTHSIGMMEPGRLGRPVTPARVCHRMIGAPPGSDPRPPRGHHSQDAASVQGDQPEPVLVAVCDPQAPGSGHGAGVLFQVVLGWYHLRWQGNAGGVSRRRGWVPR